MTRLSPPILNSPPMKHPITLACSTYKIMRQAKSIIKPSISTRTMIRPSVAINNPLLTSVSMHSTLALHPQCPLKISHLSKKDFLTHSSRWHCGPRQLSSTTSQKKDLKRRMNCKTRALPSMRLKRVYTKRNRRKNRKENQPLPINTHSPLSPTRQSSRR